MELEKGNYQSEGSVLEKLTGFINSMNLKQKQEKCFQVCG